MTLDVFGGPGVPDRRKHRGPHPQDQRLFAPSVRPAMESAVRDMSLLVSRGYADTASLKLVGDHFLLTKRQRMAVMRVACSDAAREARRACCLAPGAVRGEQVALDGYNVVTTVEAALAGGVVLCCRDGTYRDIASVHGTFRKVEETAPAVRLIGRTLAEWGVGDCRWYLDSPVSNSGRLKQVVEEVAGERGWNWSAQLDRNPDEALIRLQEHLIVSADSYVIENSEQWWSLANDVVESCVESVWVVDCGALKI